MKKQTITYAGKQIKVTSWEVDTNALYAKMKEAYDSGKPLSAQDISWLYLKDDQSVQYMKDTESGDRSDNNFAMRIFTKALDYTIGIVILDFIREYRRQHKKRINHFTLAVDNIGRAYILYGDEVILWYNQ